VVLRPKELEIRGEKNVEKKEKKKKNCTRAEKTQILCNEIEPNLSKTRAMHEGDNPSF
jgi:hypothetical protein